MVALVIYILVAIFVGPFWPLELIGGKAGPLGVLIAIGWFCLLLGIGCG